jgi:hypothetical protein
MSLVLGMIFSLICSKCSILESLGFHFMPRNMSGTNRERSGFYWRSKWVFRFTHNFFFCLQGWRQWSRWPLFVGLTLCLRIWVYSVRKAAFMWYAFLMVKLVSRWFGRSGRLMSLWPSLVEDVAEWLANFMFTWNSLKKPLEWWKSEKLKA